MSSSQPMIKLNDVSKCYQTFSRPVDRLLQSFYGSKRKLYDEFWAVMHASFEVYPGEAFGIVGQNGSGKSTLLQMIAGTLGPTSGSIECNGRIAAILELGAGFNPEFNGIENARLNAAIIGVPEQEFMQSLPAIIEFSGLGDFMYRPVKTYSSGMYVRLAFSVSISLKPDILIIDEALAVGDARFQRKCFRKLDSLKASGVTILFVSHSMESVVSHCDRALFLDQGQVQLIGEPKVVVNKYLDKLFQTDTQQYSGKTIKPAALNSSTEGVANTPPVSASKAAVSLNHDPTIDACQQRRGYNPQEYRWGDQQAAIIDFALLCNNQEFSQACYKSDQLTIYSAIYFQQAISDLIYGITIKTTDGKTVYGTNTRLQKQKFKDKQAGDIVEIKYQFTVNLEAGDYFVSLGVAVDDDDKDNVPLDRRFDLIHFNVTDDFQSFGLAYLDAKIQEL